MARLLQQSLLDCDPKKTLTIVKTPGREMPLPHEPRQLPAGKSLISELPDELLEYIVQFAAMVNVHQCSCSKGAPAENKACLKAMSLVCQRMKHLAQPLLYQDVRFKYPISVAPPSIPVIKLHRSVKENAALRQHVRFFSMHIPDIPVNNKPGKYDMLNKFAIWFTRVRCLSIHGGFEGDQNNEYTWGLIGSFVTNMKDLQHISLSREGWGLSLHHIVPRLSLSPALKILNVSGISRWRQETTSAHLPTGFDRRAPLTSLSLYDYEECPRCTALMIAWPKALTHFQFGSFYNNRHTIDYPMFESWLLIHSETLKSIEIGYLSGNGSRRMFNATLFPNLESLSLSRWQQGRGWRHQEPLRFTADDANVLGPKLKYFGWDFTIYDQHSESWNDFGENEEAWLSELVKTAISRKTCAFKTIRVFFRPDSDNSSEEDGYPWDRMLRIKDQLCEPNGLELLYTEPDISKESWLEQLRARPENYIEMLLEDAFGDNTPGQDVEDDQETEEVEEPGYHGEDIRKYFPSVFDDTIMAE